MIVFTGIGIILSAIVGLAILYALVRQLLLFLLKGSVMMIEDYVGLDRKIADLRQYFNAEIKYMWELKAEIEKVKSNQERKNGKKDN